jgi:hypothetical protein
MELNHVLKRTQFEENKFLYSYAASFEDAVSKFNIDKPSFLKLEAKLYNCTKYIMKDKFSLFYKLLILLLTLLWIIYLMFNFSTDFKHIVIIPLSVLIVSFFLAFFFYSFYKIQYNMIRKATHLIDIENKKYSTIYFKLDEFELNLEIVEKAHPHDKAKENILEQIILIPNVFNKASLNDIKELCLDDCDERLREVCVDIISKGSLLRNESFYIDLSGVVLVVSFLSALLYQLFICENQKEALKFYMAVLVVSLFLLIASLCGRLYQLTNRFRKYVIQRRKEFESFDIYVDEGISFGIVYVYKFKNGSYSVDGEEVIQQFIK